MAKRTPFQNRAHEVSRIEAFSDVIFGFAVSLLVVSLEPPKNYDQLMEMMHGVWPFAICFFIFIDMWFEHHQFFRRYALDDTPTMLLNTLLLFVILWYIYPMRFVLTLSAQSMLGHSVSMPGDQAVTLFTIYGIGFMAVFWILAAMYYQAWRQREGLALNAVERVDTQESIVDNLVTGAFGLLSVGLAHSPLIAFAGLSYFLMGITKTAVPWIMGRKRAQFEEQASAQTTAI